LLNKIFKCAKCGRYTMDKVCCGIPALSPKPAKYKLSDKYSMQRLKCGK